MMRPVAALSVIALVGLACAPAARAQEQREQKPPSIVVSGEATVRAAPDRAFVTIAVESRDKNPSEAQRDTATAMDAVRKKLAAAGVTAEQIKTVAYDLQLEFDYEKGRRIPREYLSRDAIEVRLDDVTTVGKVIDAAVSAGATTIGGVRFDLKERDALEREALRQAVADARARAEAAAAGAGVRVASVLRVEEQRVFPPQPVPMMMRAGVAAAEAAPETTISAGEIELKGQVTLTVRIE
ncbi:MAG: SIMPL domain-containing protein [Thermodesulfobacteriota bacterium]